MNYLKNIMITAILLAITKDSLASGVFKCIDADGEMTFAFTPCAKVEAMPEVVSAIAKTPARVVKAEKLEKIDQTILTL